MKRFMSICFLVVSLCCGATIGEQAYAASNASKRTLSLGTASLGGNYFTLGAAMATAIMDHSDLSVTAQATSGSTYNVGAVNDGELDLGMAQASAVASGVNGTDGFENMIASDVRTLVNFNATPVHILVSKSKAAKDITDLKGAKFECLVPGDGVELATKKLLPALGLNLSDVKLEFSGSRVQAASRLKTGQIDAIIDATGLGSSWISDIYGDGSKWALLNLTESQISTICDTFPEYRPMTIPANTYKGQNEDIITVGLWTTLFCNANMPNETAYTIVKAIIESKPELVKAHTFFKDLDKSNVIDACIAPLHPGAEKYYNEADA